jgi:hypothetical protein
VSTKDRVNHTGSLLSLRRSTLKLLFFLLMIPLVVTCETRGLPSITSEELRDHVEYLASDELEGRMTGETGTRMAEEYIAQAFSEFGLSSLPEEDDYFLEFDLYEYGYDPEKTYVQLDVEGIVYSGQPGKDFTPFFFTDTGEAEAEVVFAGYGITAPEYGYDDYEGLDVSGKIVLLLRHEPNKEDQKSPFHGYGYTRHAYFVTKAQNAIRHGAVGMILFTDHKFSGAKAPASVDDLRFFTEMRLEPSGPTSRGGISTDKGRAFLALHISQRLAGLLVAPAGWSIESLQDAVDQGAKPAQMNIHGLSAKIGIRKRSHAKRIGACNVAGFLEGRDPALKDEWIVVGGHHDHVGSFDGTGDTIFNGADDNASGTSGVLELAEAFASRETRPRRSIVFITFGAEEVGLLGSRVFVEHRQAPIEKVVFMLNLDMIGRNPEKNLLLYSSTMSSELRSTIEAVSKELEVGVGFMGYPHEASSDFAPFNERGIPFLFFFTGLHEDYHQPGDHADKLSYSHMQAIVRLAYTILDRLAEQVEPE